MKPIMLMDSIQRCINTIRAGKDFQGRGEAALRNYCIAVIRERDVTWINVAQELIGKRLSDMAVADDNKDMAIAFLSEMAAIALDTASQRVLFERFAHTCSQFNICFLAAGFGGWEENYRSREQGNVVDAKRQIELVQP